MATQQVLESLAVRAGTIVKQIEPLLGGQHSSVQGAVIAELFARWVTGHHPDIRVQVAKEHMQLIHSLMKIYDPWREERSDETWH